METNQPLMPLQESGPTLPRWVVTGGTGLVGEHLLHLMCSEQEPAQIVASYRTESRIGSQGILTPESRRSIEWMACDLLDWNQLQNLVEGAETVFHCAALISYDPQDRELLWKQNVVCTARLVDACLAAGVRRLVYISSIAALGPSRSGEPVHEDSPWNEKEASSYYGKTKFAAEMEVWRGQEEGLEVVVVNPSVILGPGAVNGGSNQLFRKVSEGLRFYTPGSLGTVNPRDVARACLLLHRRNLTGRRFLLNGANLTFLELFREMADQMKVTAPPFCPPYFMARWGILLSQWLHRIQGTRNFLSAETVKAAYTLKTYDGSRILREVPDFGYTPWKVSVADGIAAMKQRV